MTITDTRADELPRDAILTIIRQTLENYQQRDTSLPPLELTNVWINGSFGANSATETSDIDLTVELGVTTEVAEMDPLELANTLMDLGGPTARSLIPVVHRDADVTVIPAASILSELSIEVSGARTHVETTQQHGGHETAYDLLDARYVDMR